MTSHEALAGPYIVWEDYGCEGWHPSSYATPKDALTAARHNRFVLTKAIVFEIVEISDTGAVEDPQ